uniref:Uncharacterized protein n=1 Tax=Arundo donax TaxID=35708 RepID=A0A0A9GF85_ARUDO
MTYFSDFAPQAACCLPLSHTVYKCWHCSSDKRHRRTVGNSGAQ